MKKVLPHLLFWLGYWAMLEYAEFLWMKNFMPDWAMSKVVGKSVIGSFLYGLCHLTFAYYLTYIALPMIVTNRKAIGRNIALILLPYVATICAIILLAHKLVLPVVYEGIVPPAAAFFDPQKFVSLMIEVAFPAGLLMAFRLVNTELAAKNMMKEKLSTELMLLKGQLNPHFLFNTLNNIYALTRKKSDQAPEVVLKLSELLSFMLYESGKNQVPIEQEIKFLKDYIDLQKIRYTDSLTIGFNTNIDNPSQLIAPLILLPLVENAFKHGASENHFDSYIDIDMSLKDGKLNCIIQNSYEKNGTIADTRSSIGLSNTKRQLELMYGAHDLRTEDVENNFSVSLFINLNTYGKI